VILVTDELHPRQMPAVLLQLTRASQAAQAAPPFPHTAFDWLAYGVQTPVLVQQPFGHELASQTQAPPLQCWPEAQDAQTFPEVPQAGGVCVLCVLPDKQVPVVLVQQPLGQEFASHTHMPDALHSWPPLQALHAVPPTPHVEVLEGWQAPVLSQHPFGHDLASQTQLPWALHCWLSRPPDPPAGCEPPAPAADPAEPPPPVAAPPMPPMGARTPSVPAAPSSISGGAGGVHAGGIKFPPVSPCVVVDRSGGTAHQPRKQEHRQGPAVVVHYGLFVLERPLVARIPGTVTFPVDRRKAPDHRGRPP
jgi:hypothetical protein